MAKLVSTEARLFLREPVALFFALAFPLILLVGLGSIPSSREPDPDLGGLRFVDVYTPVLIAFVLAMLGSSALPALVASYRERGVLRRMATTPVPATRLLGAQLVVFAAVALAGLLVILAVARIAFGVPLPRQPLGFALAMVLATAALLSLGLLIAAVAPTAKAANAIGVLLFFPLMFLAGLWIPRATMPETLQDVSDLSPLGAAVGALQAAAQGEPPSVLHLVVLAAFAAGLGALAARLFRWE